jgi:hypothetical protein
MNAFEIKQGMNNPLQPRAALALAVAQGEDLSFGLF